MKWLFILWLTVLFITLIGFSIQFVSRLVKTRDRIRICAKLILKYLLYLIAFLLPASIVAGALNIENALAYIPMLFGFDLCLVLFLVLTNRQAKNFYWFLVAPVMPTVVFYLMAKEVERASS